MPLQAELDEDLHHADANNTRDCLLGLHSVQYCLLLTACNDRSGSI